MAAEHQQGTRKSVRHVTDSEGGTGSVVIEEGQAVTALNRERALAKGTRPKPQKKPLCADPYARWCGRTETVSPPPTRLPCLCPVTTNDVWNTVEKEAG